MKTAMILAAGRGERLRPLTEKIPKALCPVNGKTLIEHHLHKLSTAGFTKVVINHAYLGGQIRQLIGQGERFGLEIHYCQEPPGGLETGGGIVNALPFLGSAPFLTVNADIYTDFDFSTLKTLVQHDIHVVLIPKNPALGHKGDFGIENNTLTNTDCEYTLAGICIYHPKVFRNAPIGRYSVTPLLRETAAKNRISASIYQGLWSDVGTLQRLESLNEHLRKLTR